MSDIQEKYIGEAALKNTPTSKLSFILGEKVVTSAKIADGAIITDKIDDKAVGTDQIADGAVTTEKLGDYSVTEDKLHDNAVTESKIKDGEVTGSKILANAVTGDKIRNKSITSVHIAPGTITADELHENSINAVHIAANAVESKHIQENAVETSKIKNGAVTTEKILNDNVTEDKIHDDAVTTEKIANSAVTTAKIHDDHVVTAKIADKAVTTEKILDDNIITEKIADGAVTTSKIKDGNVTEAKILDGNVTTSKIASGAVTSDKIPNGHIISDKIAAGAVTTPKILNNAVTTAKILDGNVTTEKIADGAITASKIPTGEITGDKIHDGTIEGRNIAPNAIDSNHIKQNAIEGYHIAENSIPGSKILDGTIESRDIKNDTIESRKIADNAIITDKIADDAVVSSKIANGSVVTRKIEDGAIETIKLANGAVTTPKIADNAVISAIIANSAVTTTKIADDAVVTGKINSGAVTTAKIHDSAVTTEKIGDGEVKSINIGVGEVKGTHIEDGSINSTHIAQSAIQGNHIQNDAVTSDKIGNGEVNTANIAAGAVTEDKLADGAITPDKIADSTITELQTIMDEVPTDGSVKPVMSGGVQNELALGAVYDVSAKNPTAGSNNDGKWESLSALLSDTNLNILIPTAVRKGGMSIKFVQSSDNKYVQYRLMSDTFSTIVSDWQGVDDELTAGSDNLVKSGAVKAALNTIEIQSGKIISLNYTSTYQMKALDYVIPAGSIITQIENGYQIYLYTSKSASSYEQVTDSNTPYIVQNDIYYVKNANISGEHTIHLLPETFKDGNFLYLFNVNSYKLKSNAYSSVTTARNNVPTAFRNYGLTITYKMSDGWHVEQYIGSEVSEWQNNKNWRDYSSLKSSYDDSDFIRGYINRSGTFVSSTSYFVTDFIPVNPAYKLVLNKVFANRYGVTAYCFYDENHVKVDISPAVSEETTYTKLEVTIPKSAVYIRCSGSQSNGKSIESILNLETLAGYVERNNSSLYSTLADLSEQVSGMSDEIDEAVDDTEKVSNVVFNTEEGDKNADLSKVTNTGFIQDDTGTIYPSGDWRYGRIEIPYAATSIIFNNLPSAQYSSAVCSYFVDKNGTRIDDWIGGDTYLGQGVVTKSVPGNAVAIMFTGSYPAVSSYSIQFHINQVSLIEQIKGNSAIISQLQTEVFYALSIAIPDVVYAIVGTELNIWNDTVSMSIDSGLKSPQNYIVDWRCNKGLITNRCFRFTPQSSDVGMHSCTCSIYNPLTYMLIATKTFSINVVAMDALNSSKNIVYFGDSLGGDVATKLYENFNNSAKYTGVIPTMLGTRGTTPRYEAVGGYMWLDYATVGRKAYRIQVSGVNSVDRNSIYRYSGQDYTVIEVNITDGAGNLLLERPLGASGNINGVSSGTISNVSGSGDATINFTNAVKESGNPLWDDSLNDGQGGLNISKYRERLGLNPTDKLDAVSFQFGVNESLGSSININSVKNNYIIPLYNAFVADNSDCKFIIGLTTSSGNDVNGAGANYGANRNIWKYLNYTYQFRKMYIDMKNSGEFPNLEIASPHLSLDRYYGYDFSSRPISQRVSTTEQYHNNYVHCSTSGYGQMADAYLAAYVSILSE